MDTTTLCTAPVGSADLVGLDPGLRHTHPAAARDELTAMLAELSATADQRDPPAAAEAFLDQDAVPARARRWAGLATLQLLGAVHPAAVPAPIIDTDPERAKRLLLDLEVGLLRLTALRSSSPDLAASRIAALEAGAGSGELASLTDEAVEGRADSYQIRLPGTRRIAPRQVQWPAWAAGALTRLLEQRPASQPLLYTGRSNDPAAQQSSILMGVGATINASGLGSDRRVKPESIRHTAARTLYDTLPADDRLQTAADHLGITDLDRVAERIGLTPASVDTTPLVHWPALSW